MLQVICQVVKEESTWIIAVHLNVQIMLVYAIGVKKDSLCEVATEIWDGFKGFLQNGVRVSGGLWDDLHLVAVFVNAKTVSVSLQTLQPMCDAYFAIID